MQWVLRMARLLYIDDTPTPYRIGPFQKISELWSGEFKVLFCAESEPDRSYELDLGAFDSCVMPGLSWRPYGQRNPFSFKWNPGIIEEMEAFQPDVVVLSGYAQPTIVRAALWCRRRGIPYGITCETSALSTSTSGMRWRLRRAIAGPIVSNMSFGLPVGRYAADYLRLIGRKDKPMFFFPNTPDTKVFELAETKLRDPALQRDLRNKYSLAKSGAVFVFVGRMIEAKRPLDVIKAFTKLNNASSSSLLMVGDGDQLNEAKNLAKGRDNISFSGWVKSVDQLAEIFAISTSLVLPSIHEPWGAVVNEAMASRSSVISTNVVGAVQELVDHGVEGFVIQPGDIEALTDAMYVISSSTETARRMAMSAQKKALEYGADFAARNLVDGAEAAMAQRKSRGKICDE